MQKCHNCFLVITPLHIVWLTTSRDCNVPVWRLCWLAMPRSLALQSFLLLSWFHCCHRFSEVIRAVTNYLHVWLFHCQKFVETSWQMTANWSRCNLQLHLWTGLKLNCLNLATRNCHHSAPDLLANWHVGHVRNLLVCMYVCMYLLHYIYMFSARPTTDRPGPAVQVSTMMLKTKTVNVKSW